MHRLISQDPILEQRLRSLRAVRARALAENATKAIINLKNVRDILVENCTNDGSRRLLVGIGGFPASGKTTAATTIAHEINEHWPGCLAVHLPMDGFHMSTHRLLAEGLDCIKGDTRTYDLPTYVAALAACKQAMEVTLRVPDYSRSRHDVVDGAIEVGPEVRLLITEGIYVGYLAEGWSRLRALLDILFYMDSPPDVCVERIVARNLSVGRGEGVIADKLRNDLGFMEKAVNILWEADYIIHDER